MLPSSDFIVPRCPSTVEYNNSLYNFEERKFLERIMTSSTGLIPGCEAKNAYFSHSGPAGAVGLLK